MSKSYGDRHDRREFRFSYISLWGSESRTEMVDVESSLKKGSTYIVLSCPVALFVRFIFRKMENFCQDQKTEAFWTLSEKLNHINILKLEAAKYTIMPFTRLHLATKAAHVQIGDIVTPSYLINMDGTCNQILTRISKKIWEYLLQNGNISQVLNKEVDLQLRLTKDSNKWNFKPIVFQHLCKT